MDKQKTLKLPKISEAKLQGMCVEWFRRQYRNYLIFAIPNGGSRNVIEAVNLKRQGVLAGVPDLFIPVPTIHFGDRDKATGANTRPFAYSGLFVEMKVGRNKPSEAQELIMAALTTQGYAVKICYSFDEFQEVVRWYFKNMAEISTETAQGSTNYKKTVKDTTPKK